MNLQTRQLLDDDSVKISNAFPGNEEQTVLILDAQMDVSAYQKITVSGQNTQIN